MQIRNSGFVFLLIGIVVAAVVVGYIATRPSTDIDEDPNRTRSDEEDIRAPDLVVGRPGTITGEVKVFKTGEPAAGLVIRIAGPGVESSAGTDGSGRFRTTAPSGVELTVTVEAPEPYAPVVIRGVQLDPDTTEDLGTLYLERALLVRGIVVNREGTPLAGAAVAAFRPEAEEVGRNLMDIFTSLGRVRVPLEEGVAGADGTFAFSTLAPGTYRFEAGSDGFARGFLQDVIVTPEGEGHVWRIVLSPGMSLVGTVKSAQGTPVEEARVTAVNAGGRSFQQLDFRPIQTLTDDAGRYEFANLAPGRIGLMVTAEGYPQTMADRVTIGQTERMDIVLGGNSAVEGRITDKDDEPVEGAEIMVAAFRRGGAVGRALSDADGRYRIENLPSGRIQLFSVRKAGYASHPNGGDMAMMNRGGMGSLEEGATLTKDVELLTGATVTGRVTDATTGKPVPDAEVSVMGLMSRFTGGAGLISRTDENGTYRVEGVGEGMSQVEVRAPGYYQADANPQAMGNMFRPGGASNEDPPADQPLVLIRAGATEVVKDVEIFPGAVITGVVTDPKNNPVGGARVVAQAGGGGMRGFGPMSAEPAKAVLTDSTGNFKMEGVKVSENLRLRAEAQGWVEGLSDPITINSGTETAGVTIRLSAGGTVKGKVSGADGAPLAMAAVRVVADPGQRGNQWAIQWQLRQAEAVLTGPDGSYEVSGLKPGPVMIGVEGPGHQSTVKQGVTVPEGDVTDGHDFRLEQGFAIAGRVVDEQGDPVAGARLNANPAGGAGQRFGGMNQNVTTDEDGRFEIDRLTPGLYNIGVSAQDYAGEQVQGVNAGTTDLHVVLRKSQKISGTVYFPDGSAGAGCRVSARGEAGRNSSARTDENGAFEIDGLTPGVYTVSAQATSRTGPSVRRTDVNSVASGTSNLEIRLLAGTTLEGVVVDESGAPLAQANLTAAPIVDDGDLDREGGSGWASTDDQGRFTLRGLDEGMYRLNVWKPGFTLSGDPVKARGGTDGVRIVMKVQEGNSGGGGMSFPVRPR